jgi:hypothetical protein
MALNKCGQSAMGAPYLTRHWITQSPNLDCFQVY